MLRSRSDGFIGWCAPRINDQLVQCKIAAPCDNQATGADRVGGQSESVSLPTIQCPIRHPEEAATRPSRRTTARLLILRGSLRSHLRMTAELLREDDGCGHTFAFPRREFARAMRLFSARQKRGRRECRALDAPAASRAEKGRKHTSSRHYGHTGFTRHSPRNGFNKLLRALPGDQDLLTPSSADNSTDLTPTSRRQDHTTSPSAS
jgi:hypothetical protein